MEMDLSMRASSMHLSEAIDNLDMSHGGSSWNNGPGGSQQQQGINQSRDHGYGGGGASGGGGGDSFRNYYSSGNNSGGGGGGGMGNYPIQLQKNLGLNSSYGNVSQFFHLLLSLVFDKIHLFFNYQSFCPKLTRFFKFHSFISVSHVSSNFTRYYQFHPFFSKFTPFP